MNPLLIAGAIAAGALLATAGFLLARSRPSDAVAASRRPSSRPRPSAAELAVASMPGGVIVLGQALTPTLANSAARSILGLPDDALPAQLSPELAAVARQALASGSTAEADLRAWPTSTVARATAIPLGDDGGIVVILRDVTDERRNDHIRRQFVLSASHELKTPVASIQSLAEAIGTALPDDAPTAQRFSLRLIDETSRMSKLVQDLLDLSRLEDPAHFFAGHVDLSEIVRRTHAQFESSAAERGVNLEANVASTVAMQGDEHQLGLMVRNLLDNAIRHTPADGSVFTKLGVHRDRVVLEVVDTGEGIPLHAQAQVFERFFRVDAARARDTGGTGLGLAIVKHVAALHGGHVSVTSELGEGSTFTVVLPQGVDAPDRAGLLSST